MKRFLVKVVFFIAGFWLSCFLLAETADQLSPMNVYAAEQAEKLAILLEKKGSIQAISLGNSHSDAIDFATFGQEGQLLARAGTDLLEVGLFANSVAPRLPELETVFIAISYFSFSRNNVLAEDTRNLRIELYAILPTWTPLPGDIESLILGKLQRYFSIMSIVRPDHWADVFSSITEGGSEGGTELENAVESTTPWGVCSHFTQNDLAAIGYEIGGKAARNHEMMASLHPEIREQTYQALANTIELLISRGVRVVLFTPPYHISYSRRFQELAPNMIDSMHEEVDRLQANYNVEYYDASMLAEFVVDPELFYNSDHLNLCGSRAFSEYLLSEMNKR